MGYFYLAIAIVTEVAGTIALKPSEGFTKLIPSLIVVVGYGLSFYFFALVLKTIPVGVAYAMWSACGIVLITIAGAFLFGQRMDLPAIIGMSLVIIGIIVMNVFSKTVGVGN